MSEVARGNRYKYMISLYDIPIKLIHKETGSIQYAYRNLYNKVYIWLYDDNNIVFIKDELLNKYDIVEVI